MRKFRNTLLVATLSTLGFVNPAMADTIFGVYAGAGSWSGEAEGSIGSPAVDMAQLGADSQSHTYFYVSLEHPVPVIPNIKLQLADVASSQRGTLDADFNLGATQFAENAEIASNIDLSFVDATFYYEILDNWLNLDLGVTLRKFDGELSAATQSAAARVAVDTVLPMLYAKGQFDLPFSGFSFAAEGNITRFDDSTVSDLQAKVMYSFDSVIDLGLEAGYRVLDVELNDGPIKTDVQFAGPYLAALFHF